MVRKETEDDKIYTMAITGKTLKRIRACKVDHKYSDRATDDEVLNMVVDAYKSAKSTTQEDEGPPDKSTIVSDVAEALVNEDSIPGVTDQ